MFRRGAEAPRLDPVRWRPPGRGLLIRLSLAALLLTTAAAVGYADVPATCGSGGPAGRPAADGATAAPGADGTTASTPPEGPTGRGQPAAVPMPPGMVGVPIRLAEPAALAVVRPGDRVDLLAVTAHGGEVRPIAAAALVLGVGGPDDVGGGGLFVALDPTDARKAVGAPLGTRFAVVVRPRR